MSKLFLSFRFAGNYLEGRVWIMPTHWQDLDFYQLLWCYFHYVG